VCAAKLCVLQGDSCQGNSDCCSNLCDPGKKKCIIDQANSTCRPTGETCNSGPQRGCCGRTASNDLCDKKNFNPPRCIAPPEQCRGETAACASDAQCCGKVCDPATKTCKTACVAVAGACKAGADCCTSSCTNGRCDALPPPPPPPPPGGGPVGGTGPGGTGTCVPVTGTCATNADCCTAVCLAGFCAVPRPN
jgi:hypothetical protein